ncbi:MAG: glycosyltransferase family 1 protein [Candidatus Lokiarchaeota archaeon]|nr:glycosyltransferase family 1 protein [Candidatus Lokiarchaeota archaeon]
MKILHCPQKLSLSGAEFYFLRISEELAKRGHTVKISTSNALDFINLRNPSEKIHQKTEEKINGLQINRFPIDYSFKSSLVESILNSNIDDLIKYIKFFSFNINDLYKFLINGPYSPQLFKNLLKTKADLIHSIAIPYASVLYSAIIGKIKEIPKICTPFYHFENPRYEFKSYINILNSHDFILTNSDAESNYLIKNGIISQDKIRKIFMAVDVEKYQKTKNKWFLDLHEKKGPIILFCGHKNFEKGALTILDSIPSVVKEIPNVQFVFIGPSTKAFIIKNKKLKKYKKNILNLGVLPYFSKLKRGAFAVSDVYVMPSRSEAFGICYLEAWASKKPVIGSNINAIQEIIQNEHDGLLTNFNDPLDLSKKIIYMLKNEDLRESMGKEGYNKIIKNGYTYKNLVNRIETIYKEALDKY